MTANREISKDLWESSLFKWVLQVEQGKSNGKYSPEPWACGYCLDMLDILDALGFEKACDECLVDPKICAEGGAVGLYNEWEICALDDRHNDGLKYSIQILDWIISEGERLGYNDVKYKIRYNDTCHIMYIEDV